MKKGKKVALVLSGGAALGFAHIGVIKVLEKYNIPIDMIVGTSMGSIVGASYALGFSAEEMTEFAGKFKGLDFLDVNLDISGIFSGKGVMRILNQYIPDINIEELNTKFACVAVDLATEKEVRFKEGSLRDAVRASLSIPGIFVPLKKGKQVLVDGGLLNNLPEDLAVEMGADIIISCDVLNKFSMQTTPKHLVDTIMYSMNLCAKIVQGNRTHYADITIYPDLNDIKAFSFNLIMF